MVMYFGAAAIADGTQQRVRRSNPNLVRTACWSTEDVCWLHFICKHLKV